MFCFLVFLLKVGCRDDRQSTPVSPAVARPETPSDAIEQDNSLFQYAAESLAIGSVRAGELPRALSMVNTVVSSVSRLMGSSSPQIIIIISGRAMSSSSSSSSSEYCACLTSVSKEEDARRLARLLVEERLAACVNIIPGVQSIYEWQSAIHEDQELILMIKTRRESVEQVNEFLKKNHPYELPELIALNIDNGNPNYLRWIDSIVKR